MAAALPDVPACAAPAANPSARLQVFAQNFCPGYLARFGHPVHSVAACKDDSHLGQAHLDLVVASADPDAVRSAVAGFLESCRALVHDSQCVLAWEDVAAQPVVRRAVAVLELQDACLPALPVVLGEHLAVAHLMRGVHRAVAKEESPDEALAADRELPGEFPTVGPPDEALAPLAVLLELSSPVELQALVVSQPAPQEQQMWPSPVELQVWQQAEVPQAHQAQAVQQADEPPVLA